MSFSRLVCSNMFRSIGRRRLSSGTGGRRSQNGGFDFVQLATGLAFGAVAYKAYALAVEWPEGNRLLFNSMRDDKAIRKLVGSPVFALPTWEGVATEDMVRVEIPIIAGGCCGTLTGAAVKANGEWIVLACEFQPTMAITGGSSPVPVGISGKTSGVERPPPASLDIAIAEKRSYDVLAKRWMDSLYSIGAESDFTKDNAHTKAHVEVVGSDGSLEKREEGDQDGRR